MSINSVVYTVFALSMTWRSIAVGASTDVAVHVEWNNVIAVSKTTVTMMHMVHPVSREGTAIHDKAIAAIKDLNARYVRYMNWDLYPRLSVAELYPPGKARTSWDFSLIDPEIVPYLETTQGREPVVSFAAIPAWMFKNDKPVVYPDDPNQAVLSRPLHGTDLLEPSGEQAAQYFARIASWYTQGGFTDETGKYHRSGYHYELPWWEVLNEADGFTPEQYTRLSDAIITAVHRISPKTRFIGLSLASGSPEFFEYWLDPKNHRSGITLDMMAYHFYALPATDLLKYDPNDHSTIDSWQYTFFDRANGFITKVEYIEAIRKRLSPSTRVNLDELGTYAPGDFDATVQDTHIPPAYWNLSAGVFAYLYAELAKQGIDILAQSLLATGPGMAPGNTMLNWRTGKPNARFYVLKLLNDSFAPGDRLVKTTLDQDANGVAAQGFLTSMGKRLLIINKRFHSTEVKLDAAGGRAVSARVVDEGSGEDPPRNEQIRGQTLHLEPFAVAVVTIA